MTVTRPYAPAVLLLDHAGMFPKRRDVKMAITRGVHAWARGPSGPPALSRSGSGSRGHPLGPPLPLFFPTLCLLKRLVEEGVFIPHGSLELALPRPGLRSCRSPILKGRYLHAWFSFWSPRSSPRSRSAPRSAWPEAGLSLFQAPSPGSGALPGVLGSTPTDCDGFFFFSFAVGPSSSLS